MTFTIPPFWCGVIATVLAEIAVLIAIGIKKTIDDKRNMKLKKY